MSRHLAILTALFVGLISHIPASPDSSGTDQEAIRADESFLKEHHIPLDDRGLLEFFRQRTLTDARRREIAKLIRQLGSVKFQEREQASRDLVKCGPLALALLRPALKDPDLEIARRAEQCILDIEEGPGPSLPMAVARLLAQRHPAGTAETLLRYLPQAAGDGIEDEIFQALAALIHPKEKPDPALLAALKDAVPLRRAAAGFAVGRHEVKEHREAVLPLLKDKEALVRLRAAQGLALGGEKAAVPVLIALVGEGREELTWFAEELLQQLAGENAPAGNPENPAARRDAWLSWWKEHSERVDMGRLIQKSGALGLTLFIEYDTNRVFECGKDGKVRWTIQARGPMDAQVLPGNRVLIAEGGASRTTERDLKGNILWEYDAFEEPINCQRLANGNTFIGFRTGVMEVSRDGKVLFKHKTGEHLNSVSRLRNGHFIYLTSGGKVAELNAAGKQVWSVQLPVGGSWGDVKAHPGGRYLVCNYGDGRVFEIDTTGKVLWEHKVETACGVTRLASGNLLLGCSQRAIEIDRSGRVLWECPSDGFVRRVHRR